MKSNINIIHRWVPVQSQETTGAYGNRKQFQTFAFCTDCYMTVIFRNDPKTIDVKEW